MQERVLESASKESTRESEQMMATALTTPQGARQKESREAQWAMSGSDMLGQWTLDLTHNVDCLTGLRDLPADSLDVVVTSPPYWGQRGSGGLGSEEDPREYVRNLTAVLAEAMRCIKPSGTLWLNIGDAYNTPINWREDDCLYSSLGSDGTGLPATNSAYTKKRGRRRAFIDDSVGWLQYGNLLAIPSRVAIVMADMGFLFRGEVIWEKSRPLPEGICRRPHRRHEGIYIFAKSERHIFRVKPPVGSVWRLTQTPNLTPHCSTFPLDLPVQCIKASGLENSGGVICDPFMGSGTTGRAALALGHRFIGFELDSSICRMANQRVHGSNQPGLAFK
jgi:DNA modification methylase